MEKIKIDLNNIKPEELGLIEKYLKQGKVVVLPTDTVYGLSCLATSKKGVEKIHKIKRSDKNKPLLVMIKGYCMLKEYAKVSKKQIDYLRTVWPSTTREARKKEGKKIIRPVTAVLETESGKLKYTQGKDKSIALRLPKSEFMYKIINRVGFPIVSTSLNVSGEKVIYNLSGITDKFKVLPDLVVDAGNFKKTQASKIIDVRDINSIKILRK